MEKNAHTATVMMDRSVGSKMSRSEKRKRQVGYKQTNSTVDYRYQRNNRANTGMSRR